MYSKEGRKKKNKGKERDIKQNTVSFFFGYGMSHDDINAEMYVNAASIDGLDVQSWVGVGGVFRNKITKDHIQGEEKGLEKLEESWAKITDEVQAGAAILDENQYRWCNKKDKRSRNIWLVHAGAPHYQGDSFEEDGYKKLYSAYHNAFLRAKECRVSSIAVPPLGIGIYNIPANISATAAYDAIAQFYKENSDLKLDIYIPLWGGGDPDKLKNSKDYFFFKKFQQLVANGEQSYEINTFNDKKIIQKRKKTIKHKNFDNQHSLIVELSGFNDAKQGLLYEYIKEFSGNNHDLSDCSYDSNKGVFTFALKSNYGKSSFDNLAQWILKAQEVCGEKHGINFVDDNFELQEKMYKKMAEYSSDRYKKRKTIETKNFQDEKAWKNCVNGIFHIEKDNCFFPNNDDNNIFCLIKQKITVTRHPRCGTCHIEADTVAVAPENEQQQLEKMIDITRQMAVDSGNKVCIINSCDFKQTQFLFDKLKQPISYNNTTIQLVPTFSHRLLKELKKEAKENEDVKFLINEYKRFQKQQVEIDKKPPIVPEFERKRNTSEEKIDKRKNNKSNRKYLLK